MRKLVLDSTENAGNRKYGGMILRAIAATCNQRVGDCFLDVYLEDDLRLNWQQQASPSNGANLEEIANQPLTVPEVLDGGANVEIVTARNLSIQVLT